MRLLKSIVHRVKPPPYRFPPPPVRARDSYPSLILSLDDQSPGPSERLMRIALDAVDCVVRHGIELDDVAAVPNVPEWFNVWPGEHYRLLAAMMVVLRPRVVV